MCIMYIVEDSILYILTQTRDRIIDLCYYSIIKTMK